MSRVLIYALLATLVGIAAAAAQAVPSPLDANQVEAGRDVYEQFCASCHVANGEGAPNWRKPNAQGELPPPPHNSQGHTWRHSDAALYRMISNGWRDPFNKTSRLTMPSFAKILAPAEIGAVITYLKSLWTDDQRKYQWEESKTAPLPAEAEQPHQ